MTVARPSEEELAREFGTPLYLYDLAELRRSALSLRASLPESGLLYSLKANPHPALVRELCSLGIGAEVSSCKELLTASGAGVDAAADLVFTSPAKSEAELSAAIRLGARTFSTDSADQLELLAAVAVAEPTSTQVRTLLRINPPKGLPSAGLAMTGVPSQFGVDVEQILAAPSRFGSRAGCDVIGYHVYLGSNAMDGRALAQQFAASLAMAAMVSERLSLQPEVINLGGGFGRSYAAADTAIDLSGVRVAVAEALATSFPDPAR